MKNQDDHYDNCATKCNVFRCVCPAEYATTTKLQSPYPENKSRKGMFSISLNLLSEHFF